MGEPAAPALARSRAMELLSISRFEEELRRTAHGRSGAPIATPLDAAVKKIEKDPAFTQCRLLTRVLAALAHGGGEFRHGEISTFDSDTRSLVFALLDARASGSTPLDQWVLASGLANAAQREIDG